MKRLESEGKIEILELTKIAGRNGLANLDLLLINPNSSAAYRSLAEDHVAIEPCVWAGLIATYIRLKGYNVKIIDADAERLTPTEVADRAKQDNPRLAAIVCYGHQPSASTQMIPAARILSCVLRDFGIGHAILGGHPSALPERTLRESCAEHVLIGEGPITLLQMLNAPVDVWGTIHGESHINYAGEYVASAPAPLITDLNNEMPGVAWDLLPMDKYRCELWCTGYVNKGRSPYWSVYSSLSCHWNCTFCLSHELNGYREWAPSVVVDSIERAVEDYGCIQGKLADELPKPKHLEALCDEMIKRGTGKRTGWWAYSCVDVANERLIQNFRDAGGHTLVFGLESAVESVREDVNKAYKQETIYRVRDLCRNHDVGFVCNLIFGLPEDSRDTMEQTLQLAIDLLPDYVNMCCCVPYPGSLLYEEVSRNHPEWLPDGWINYSQHAPGFRPLPTSTLTASQVRDFRDAAWLRYYGSESYKRMMQTKYGSAAYDAITEMTKVKLHREAIT